MCSVMATLDVIASAASRTVSHRGPEQRLNPTCYTVKPQCPRIYPNRAGAVTASHLHVHIMDNPSFDPPRLPCQFDTFTRPGTVSDENILFQGAPCRQRGGRLQRGDAAWRGGYSRFGVGLFIVWMLALSGG